MKTLSLHFLLSVLSFCAMIPQGQAQTDTELLLEEDTPKEPKQQKEGNSNIYFGFKGGLTLANQKWNTFQHRVMPTYHGDLLFEYLGKSGGNNGGRRFGFLASLGYHQRGGTYRVWNIAGKNTRPRDVFHNVVVVLAGKGVFRIAPRFSGYYGLGLRAEYTVKRSLVNVAYDPYVRPFNYGVWFAGGIEFMINKAAFFLELSISPDVSRQVYVPPGVVLPFVDPITGQQILSQQEKVYNLSFELSLGVKFGRNDIAPAP